MNGIRRRRYYQGPLDQFSIKLIGATLFGIAFFISILQVSNSQSDSFFILGRGAGEGMLMMPSHVKEGPDGNIYVLDRGDSFIKVYSPEGKHLRRLGGAGQGPGEIQRADGANFGFTQDGQVYITETFGGHRWISVLELTGEVDELIHLDFKENFGIGESFALSDGGFLLEVWFGSIPEMHKDYFLYRYPQSLIRVDFMGKLIAEIVKTDYLKTISGVYQNWPGKR
jgi:hypothetical protein